MKPTLETIAKELYYRAQAVEELRGSELHIPEDENLSSMMRTAALIAEQHDKAIQALKYVSACWTCVHNGLSCHQDHPRLPSTVCCGKYEFNQHLNMTKLCELADLEVQGKIDYPSEKVKQDSLKHKKLGEYIDTIISHNESIALWINVKDEGPSYKRMVWSGMAHELPDYLLDVKVARIFGTIPESILEADRLNILIYTG